MAINKTSTGRFLLIILTSLLIFCSCAAAEINVKQNLQVKYDIEGMISTGFPEDLLGQVIKDFYIPIRLTKKLPSGMGIVFIPRRQL
jgi:hypothetical protein